MHAVAVSGRVEWYIFCQYRDISERITTADSAESFNEWAHETMRSQPRGSACIATACMVVCLTTDVAVRLSELGTLKSLGDQSSPHGLSEKNRWAVIGSVQPSLRHARRPTYAECSKKVLLVPS